MGARPAGDHPRGAPGGDRLDHRGGEWYRADHPASHAPDAADLPGLWELVQGLEARVRAGAERLRAEPANATYRRFLALLSLDLNATFVTFSRALACYEGWTP